jgi:hypothetical protein
MESKPPQLPGEVTMVAVFNLIAAALALMGGFAVAILAGKMSDVIKYFVYFSLSLFIGIGILQRSRAARMIALILAWPAIILYGMGALLALLELKEIRGFLVLMFLMAIAALTVWGLRTKEAKAYFTFESTEDPYRRR